MNVSDFSFDLPNDLIARFPLKERSTCRLLSLNGNSGDVSHGFFRDFLNYVEPGDLLVFNDTKVIPARIFGEKESGGKLELLIERILPKNYALAHIKSSRSPKIGTKIWLGSQKKYAAMILSRKNELFELQFEHDVLTILNEIGHIPLPPYMQRADEQLDRSYYQTIYGTNLGAVAAPTAGLHFDEFMFEQLQQKGAEFTFVTLHVGAGTFQPVRVNNIHDHIMHSEFVHVSDETANQILACKKRGNKVIAIGTTSVRSLETAATKQNQISSFSGETNIFIFPSYKFKIVDAMITNFHLPESTLLMLVCAFSGYSQIMNAYNEAIQQKYRFFSYGDAMFLTKNTQ